jgi:hypothetical protein
MCLLTGSVVISIVLLALAPTGASAEQGGLEKRVAQLEAQVTALTAALQEAQEILQFVRVETEEMDLLAGPHWIIEGANVHVRSGSGDTQDGCGLLEPDYPNCESLTGLGNLIVGYNERGRGVPDRSGSHNLIVGRSHIYGSFGGLVAGRFNTILGAFASVSGGERNIASGDFSSVSGGLRNDATAHGSTVSGGLQNEASGEGASVSGGLASDASGFLASVSGGAFNQASGSCASVSGGQSNEAAGGGGVGSFCAGEGGVSSVSGGAHNLASGDFSSVSGGENRTASGEFDWAAGSLFEEN